jgi:hypothetical protein
MTRKRKTIEYSASYLCGRSRAWRNQLRGSMFSSGFAVDALKTVSMPENVSRLSYGASSNVAHAFHASQLFLN